MDDAAAVAASDHSLFEAWRTLARAAEAGEVVEEDGLLFVSFGIPVVLLNAAFVTAAPAAISDAEALVERARAFFGLRGLPFLLRLPDPVAPAVHRAARRAGMAELDPLPGMALDPVPPALPARPAGLDLRPVRAGDRSMGDYRQVLSEGFDVPPGLAEIFSAGAAVVAGRVRPQVGYLHGAPVACSAVLLTGPVAGIYNVAVTAACRGRGFGTALTWAAVAAGREAGAGAAVLQSTPLGEPVYRRMGFRTVTRYHQFG